ncbi:hypothetical protein EMCRGX_G008868 [Ephydatia muelleri]
MNLTRNNGSDEKPDASKASLFSYGTQVVVGTVGGFVGGILPTIYLGACVILSIAKSRKLDDSLKTRNPVEGAGCNGGGDVDIDGYGISMNIEMQNMSEILIS